MIDGATSPMRRVAAYRTLFLGDDDRRVRRPFPVTIQGRFIAGGLILAGIALLGIVTGALVTWLLDKVRQVEVQVQAVTQADLTALKAEVHALRAELATATPRYDAAGDWSVTCRPRRAKISLLSAQHQLRGTMKETACDGLSLSRTE